MKRLIPVLCTMLASLVALPGVARGQPPKDQLKAQLKDQFKSREADLRTLKQQGKVGETIDGYLAAVQPGPAPDEKTARLISDENKDRRTLYQVLADEINKEHPEAKVKATMETIATRNALRNIEHAGPDERLMVAKDQWIRVKDFPRYQKIATLKAQGKVGETGAGLVEIVKPEDRSDKTLAGVVQEENTARAADYKAQADQERADAAAVAKRAAKRNFDNARIGDMLKDESGAWRRR